MCEINIIIIIAYKQQQQQRKYLNRKIEFVIYKNDEKR